MMHLYRIAIALILVAAACNASSDSLPSGETSNGSPRGELIVFAAASLGDAFDTIAKDFQKEYPAIDLKMSFAGSQSLRTQIQNGAQPQVFASANAQHMDTLMEERLVGEAVTFVHNELIVVVPKDNPAGITSLEELPKGKRIVLAGKAVPAGTYAEIVLDNASATYGSDFRARVDKNVVSRETHVRQTLQKVVLGEADAAIVYATDALSAGASVVAIPIPGEFNVRAAYPIAVVRGTPRSELGELFVDFVRSDAGRSRLVQHGFRPAGAKAEVR